MSESFEDKREEIADEDFGSTIFSAPEEKHDKVEKPKLLKKIIIGAVSLVVLVGVITGVALLVDKMTTDTDDDNAIAENFVLGEFVTVEDDKETFNYDAVSKINLDNGKFELELYSKLGEDEDSSTKWLESTMAEEYTSETTVQSLAKSVLGLKYTRVISEELKDGVDYGFDKPAYTAKIKPYEKDEFTVTVGKQAVDQSGYYVTVSNGTKVYLVRNSYIEKLVCEDKMELAKALSVSAFSESDGSAEYYNSGTLAKFDHLYFKNKNLGEKYKFITVDQSDSYSFSTYRIAEPIDRMANDVGVVPIIELFSSGFDSKGLYSLTKTEEEIKKYGLDTPDMETSIKAGKQERTVVARLQEDGDYAVIVSDFDVILRVSASSLSPVSVDKKDIYSSFLFIETLADIEEFTIESAESKNSFGIVVDEKDDGTKKITGVKINGADASAPEEFQSYYQFLLGVKTLSYEKSDISGKASAATITMTKKDGSARTQLEYYEVENGRYQVVVNGEQMGIIGSSSFKNILKYAENVAAGKLYNS